MALQAALATGIAAAGSLQDIDHVVLFMQENRAFDHYFGTMAGVRGFKDPNALMPKSTPATRPSFTSLSTAAFPTRLITFFRGI